jgi:HK97 family phage prohead protease
MDRKDARFSIKEVTETGTFMGYGSVYGVLDDGDDIVAPGAFGASLAESASKGVMPALLWQHRSSEPCGAYTMMKEDPIGLYVEGKLALKTQRGAEAYELMQMKAISGLSVGFMTREDSFDNVTGIRTIKKADLWECSLVTFPMNDMARVSGVKSIDEIEDLNGMERHLREVGGVSRSEAKALVSRMLSIARREAAPDPSVELKALMAAIQGREQVFST